MTELTPKAQLTPKAEHTRQLILNTALNLFTQQGYAAATMRDIAAEAGVSLGLAYRYFESKESLVLALYDQMSRETDAAIADLPSGSMADRFVATMQTRLEQSAPYREAFGALFGVIMTPRAGAALLGEQAREMRQRAEAAFIDLVRGSKDQLKNGQVEDIGKLLFVAHFAAILFWLHDHSEGQRHTKALLGFIHDTLPLLRHGLRVPVISNQMSRFVRIIDGVLGAYA